MVGDVISEAMDEVLAMAAVGGLSHDERASVAALLRDSAATRQRYAEYRVSLTGAMLMNVPLLQAPAGMEERLRARVRAEPRPAVRATAQPKPAGFMAWLGGLFAHPARAFLPLAIAVAVGLGVLNFTLVNRLAGEQANLANAQARVAALNLVLASPQLINVAVSGANNVGGRLLCAPRQPGVLALTGLPTVASHTYLINMTRKEGGAVDTIQTFGSEPDGTAQVVFRAPVITHYR